MEKIKVLIDTNIIQDNTGDAVQIQITNDVPITEPSIVISDSLEIKGDNLVKTVITTANLGVLKTRLAGIPDRRTALQQQLAELDKEEADTQALIDQLQPAVDDAISAKVTSGAMDIRTKVTTGLPME
jgi:hypothetical protein